MIKENWSTNKTVPLCFELVGNKSLYFSPVVLFVRVSCLALSRDRRELEYEQDCRCV